MWRGVTSGRGASRQSGAAVMRFGLKQNVTCPQQASGGGGGGGGMSVGGVSWQGGVSGDASEVLMWKRP